MTISNRKPPGGKEAPAEPLKRAIAGCMRAVAKRPELEVAFASERPALTGERARLPEPPRRLTPNDIAVLRGHADSMSLRLACHDTAVHRRRSLHDCRHHRSVRLRLGKHTGTPISAELAYLAQWFRCVSKRPTVRA